MALEAGQTRTFRVRMVIPRDAGGHLLTPDLTARYFHLASSSVLGRRA